MSAIDNFLHIRQQTKVLNGVEYRDDLHDQAASEYAALVERNGTLETALQCASAANWDGIIWGRKSPFQNIINNLVGNPPYEGIVKPTETIAQVCAYCGVEASGRDEMMAHIQVCDKHPLAALRAELAAANKAVEELNKLSESYELELAGYRLALHRLQEMLTAHPEKEQE